MYECTSAQPGKCCLRGYWLFLFLLFCLFLELNLKVKRAVTKSRLHSLWLIGFTSIILCALDNCWLLSSWIQKRFKKVVETKTNTSIVTITTWSSTSSVFRKSRFLQVQLQTPGKKSTKDRRFSAKPRPIKQLSAELNGALQPCNTYCTPSIPTIHL